MTKNQLLDILHPHGQEHLLAFWDNLDRKQQESLARQIEEIDFALIRRLYEGRQQQTNFSDLADKAEPPPVRLDVAQNPFTPQQAQERAEKALCAGQVGALLVAGGQGTRLGFDHPKGMFPIGPISNKTLFQIHIEKIVAASRRYGVRIPLYMMTSPATHAETAAFFAAHDRFGLPQEDLVLFCQGTMPAVDEKTGRVLLESPGRIATSPDGHGGMLAAMACRRTPHAPREEREANRATNPHAEREEYMEEYIAEYMGKGSVLDDIERRGIRHLFYFQVDNPLVDICGREFLGYHLLANSELSSQVIAKRDPLERVGNVVRIGDRLMVIEYSDLSDAAAMRRNADGSLAIWAGSIAVHVIDAALLRRLADTADGLPFHIARKKVAHIDPSGKQIEPLEPNAIKFERFIFDLIPLARNAIVVEVDPAKAFAPLKNASGAKDDTPESVRAQMAAQARDWLRQAGVKVEDDAIVEISPLFALDAEELAKKLPPGVRMSTGILE